MKTLVVTAAVVEQDGAFLVTRRLKGTHLAGTWEFPGGKCEEDEPLEVCLRREMREELAVNCTLGAELFTITHDYGDQRRRRRSDPPPRNIEDRERSSGARGIPRQVEIF